MVQFVLSEKVMENHMQYKNLLKQISLKCANISLAEIKKYFASSIQSHRALSKVHTFQDFLCLLEKRNIINPENVAPLKILGDLLNDSSIKQLVQVYEKINDISSKCCFCDTKYDFQLTSNFPDQNQRLEDCDHNKNSEGFEIENDEKLTFDQACKNIAARIGSSWRVLASELKVLEWQVDDIRSKYPNDFVQQARKMLKYWGDNNKGNVNLKILRKALEARLCKRKGIGVHLMEPISGLTS